jgi:hypothetical protein
MPANTLAPSTATAPPTTVSLSAGQIAVVNTALGVCKQLQAPYAAAVALIYAGLGESSLGDSPNTYSGTGGTVGVWQAQPGHYSNGHDVAGQARGFLTGGTDFQAGGAIVCANRGDPIWQIANEVEANAVWINSHGDSYAGRASVDQAKAIVAQYGGSALVAKGGTAGLGGTGTSASNQNLYQFTIGQTGNPNEDYWTGICRLASDVSWYLFSDSERLYYMDGADLIAQTPAAYIDRVEDSDQIQHLSGSYDNTSYQYASTHRHKQRVQRKTSLAHVSSPTQIQLDIICPIDYFRGGDVVVLSSFGLMDGRWLVASCQRSVFAIFSTLTLRQPPTAPRSQPSSTRPRALLIRTGWATTARGSPARSKRTANRRALPSRGTCASGQAQIMSPCSSGTIRSSSLVVTRARFSSR